MVLFQNNQENAKRARIDTNHKLTYNFRTVLNFILKCAFYISQRAVLIHPFPVLSLHLRSFHLKFHPWILAQFSFPGFPLLFGSPELQLVKTTLLPVDSETQCPSEWRSVMPSQNSIFRETKLRRLISAMMALFSSADSISTRRAGNCCSSSQNFLASLCVSGDSWNLEGRRDN